MVGSNGQPIYASGECEVDLAKRELRIRGAAAPLGARAFEIIEVLTQSAGELVSKEELMKRVWPGVVVLENTLQVHIAAARRALGPYRSMLKTEAGRGYRLLGSWSIRQQHPLRSSVVAFPQIREPRQAPATNLPGAVNQLIGRSAASGQVRDLLSAFRVVTLTGTGGIGKTALALDVTRGLLSDFDERAWIVELASLSDPDLVPSAVAGVLGLELGAERISAEAVARAVGQQTFLLLLDNCEHVIDAAAALAEAIVRLCPRVAILATSREILRIEGECVYRVAPLDVPAVGRQARDEILGCSAVELFVERTKASGVDVSFDAPGLRSVAVVCRRLDGIPLAIELAAARAVALGIEELAARLNDRFAVLTGGRRTALPRHQTLRATLDWSYDLLPAPEQSLLRHLAVFVGGVTVEGAVAVMRGTGCSEASVTEILANLVEKSLAVRDPSAAAGRWQLLETIRAYALEKLAKEGEAEDAARRHAEFFNDLFGSAGDASQLRPSAEDMARFERELDNIRAALDWSFSPAGHPEIGAILTAHCALAWLHSTLLSECADRTERARQHITPNMQLSDALRMQLHLALGVSLGLTMGDVDRAKAAMTQGLELGERLADRHAQLRALWALWALHINIGDARIAQTVVERFSSVAGRVDDQAAWLVAERLRGYTFHHLGEHEAAEACCERVLQLSRDANDQSYVLVRTMDQHIMARAMLARVLWYQGRLNRATEHARASLEEAQSNGYRLSICEVLRVAGCPLALMAGDLAAAEQAIAMLRDIADGSNAGFYKIPARLLQGKLLIARGEFAAGVALLRSELYSVETPIWALARPEFLGALAEGLAGLGRLAEALETANEAVTKADEGGERYYVPELHRIRGEMLLKQGAAGSALQAKDCFGEALQIARQQGALFWELRAALSLARLSLAEDRPEVARNILAPVYPRFTEGFGTPDLAASKALLESLPAAGAESGPEKGER